MKKYSNSTYIFWHRIIKGFADALVKLFIPLLILRETGDIFLSFLYCAISYAITAVLFAGLRKFITKYPVLSIIIHIVPIIAIQFLVNNINIVTIIIIGILDAFATTLYWAGINFIFGFYDEKTNIAKFETAEHLGRIFFITLSAFVLGKIQNSLIFITIFAGVMYLTSVIPLLINYKTLSAQINVDTNLKTMQILKDTKHFNNYHIWYSILFFFNTIFLPLYLYSKGLSFTSTGLILVLQEIIFIAGTYVTALFEKYKIEKIMVIIYSGIILAGFVSIWILENIVVIYILTLLLSFCVQGIFVLIMKRFIINQKQNNYFQNTIFYRDVIQNSARTIVSGVYAITLFVPIMFVFGIASSIGIGFSTIDCLKKTENK